MLESEYMTAPLVQLSTVYAPDVKVAPPNGTVLLAYRGSISHGMYIPSEDPTSIDDIDLMGFVVGSIEHYFGLHEWGSRGTREIKEGKYDCVYYELQKAFSLLLQGNPNIMSMLWLHPQSYLLRMPVAARILDNRQLFVGKHVYNAFAGYAFAQMKKMETREPAELREYLGVTAELKARGLHPNHKGEKIPPPEGHPSEYGDWSVDVLRQRLASFQKKGENIGYMGDKRKHLVLEHGYDAKNAAHLIRLLRMSIEFMADGVLRPYRTDDAGELLDIKRGKWPLTEVKKLADDLFSRARAARDQSPLPEGPDRPGAERLLVEILREHFA